MPGRLFLYLSFGELMQQFVMLLHLLRQNDDAYEETGSFPAGARYVR